MERVIRGGERPALKDKWPQGFKDLLTQCWLSPAERPPFHEVAERLAGLLRRELVGLGPILPVPPPALSALPSAPLLSAPVRLKGATPVQTPVLCQNRPQPPHLQPLVPMSPRVRAMAQAAADRARKSLRRSSSPCLSPRVYQAASRSGWIRPSSRQAKSPFASPPKPPPVSPLKLPAQTSPEALSSQSPLPRRCDLRQATREERSSAGLRNTRRVVPGRLLLADAVRSGQ